MYDTLYLDALQNASPKRDHPLHVAVRSDTYTDDANQTMKDDEY